MFKFQTLQAEEDADLVEKSIGAFGPWHLWAFIGLLLIKIPMGAHMLSIVFLAPPTTFSCVNDTVPPCSDACQAHLFNRLANLLFQTLVLNVNIAAL